MVGYYNFDQGNPNQANATTRIGLPDLSVSKNNGTLNAFTLSGNTSNWICSEAPIGNCNDTTRMELTGITPANNGTYKVNGLPTFTWKWSGPEPAPTVFYLEVFSLQKDRAQPVFSRQIDANNIPASAIFGNKPPAPGLYRWQVTDPETGVQSPPAYFTVFSDGGCGTVSSTLRLVCSDWTPAGLPIYTATLTLTNTPTVGTAGCAATYNTIQPVSGQGAFSSFIPSLSVIVPAGGTQTITFTFVPASLSQTNVTAQCFGLWSDAMGNSVNLGVNVPIPPCLCNDCEKVNLKADGINVVPVAGIPGRFNITGTLTAGVPVDAVEFQVQTYNFNATPASCSNGVTSVENSGMLLNPATTINGSSTLVWFNETISPPSPLSNPNAAKDVKWIGGPIAAGAPIPFGLTIGLPAPLPGLPPNCCVMRYRVCIKATVWFDQRCRACSIVFCRDFTN